VSVTEKEGHCDVVTAGPNPGRHTPAEAPPQPVVFASHGTHVLQLVDGLEYVFDGHIVHPVGALASPWLSQWNPEYPHAHASQANALVPEVPAYLVRYPVGHDVQTVAAAALYVPTGHCVQTVPTG